MSVLFIIVCGHPFKLENIDHHISLNFMFVPFFVSDLISRYLESFEKKFPNHKEKEEDEKLKERNKVGLIELRNQIMIYLNSRVL